MIDRRVWLAVAVVPYVVVLAAMLAGWVPVWCLGIVFAAPLAVRVARTAQRPIDAKEFAAVFLAQLVLGYIIQTVIR